MKSYKILLFIVSIIAFLAVVSVLFPKKGVQIGKTNLNFPSVEDVLVREPVEDVDVDVDAAVVAFEDSIKQEKLKSLRDTLTHYKEVLVSNTSLFTFPNDDVTYLDRAFDKMRQARDQKRVIRILHYGDSQIEMDRLSANLREFFQSKFGGGGPGMLPAIQTIPSAVVRQSTSGSLTAYAPYGDAGKRTKSGNYGIMAKSYFLSGTATVNITASSYKSASDRVKQFSSVKILVNDHNGKFKAKIKAKGIAQDFVLESPGKGIRLLECRLDSPTTKLTVNLSGSSDIYGIMVDDGYGVNVDNIPLRGCSGTIFTQIDENILQQAYQLADIGLILLQFGGNSVPALYSDASVERFVATTVRQMQYVKRLCPQAAIVFIGPSDMSTRKGGKLRTYPYLPKLVEGLKAAAVENGICYWDLYQAMGGEGSMIQWVKSGLAGPDYVHFTPKGALKMGEIMAGSFEEVYSFYQMRSNIDKTQLDTLWSAK